MPFPAGRDAVAVSIPVAPPTHSRRSRSTGLRKVPSYLSNGSSGATLGTKAASTRCPLPKLQPSVYSLNPFSQPSTLVSRPSTSFLSHVRPHHLDRHRCLRRRTHRMAVLLQQDLRSVSGSTGRAEAPAGNAETGGVHSFSISCISCLRDPGFLTFVCRPLVLLAQGNRRHQPRRISLRQRHRRHRERDALPPSRSQRAEPLPQQGFRDADRHPLRCLGNASNGLHDGGGTALPVHPNFPGRTRHHQKLHHAANGRGSGEGLSHRPRRDLP